MKFQEYLNKKKQVKESQKLNEFSGDEGGEVDFGLFKWGGGGEFDALGAATLAAGLLLAKSIYNGVIYGMLKAALPAYLKDYKKAAAPKSRDIFDAEYDRDKIDPLKQEKGALMGTGGSREDDDLRGDKEEEKSAKQKIENYFRAAIEKAPTEDRKAQLRDKRDTAIQQVEAKIQGIQKKIDALTDKKEVEWAKIQEDWRRTEEKFEEKQKGFVEVRDSILASSWRKKWEKEFVIAKKEADIEVLEEAQQIATDNKDKRELDAIKNAKKRAEESLAAANQAIDEITDENDKAEAQNANMEQLGVVSYMTANTEYNLALQESFKKWGAIANSQDGSEEKTADPKALKFKIEKAEKKIESGKKKAQELKDAGDTEKADKILAAVSKIEGELETYKEELSKIGESLSDAQWFLLNMRINEAIMMIDALLEEEEKKELGFTDLRKVMQKAISGAPDKDKKKLLDEAIKDVSAIKDKKTKMTETRNDMVDKFEEFKGKSDEEGEKLDLPKGSEMYSSLKKLDPAKEIKSLDDTITDFKEQGGEEETKKSGTDAEQGVEETPKGGDEENIKKAKEDLKKFQEGDLKNAKEKLETASGKDTPDETEVANLKLEVKKAELQELKLKVLIATLEKNEKEKNDLTGKAAELADEIQAAETKGSGSDEPEESEEIKQQKEKISSIEADIKSLKEKPLSAKFDAGFQKIAIEDQEKQLAKAKEKLEELKNKSSEKKEESNQTKIAPKYMKFEEFMAMKNQK